MKRAPGYCLCLILLFSLLCARASIAAEVKVMTRNLYIGGDVTRILEVTSLLQVPAMVSQIWAAIQESDFPQRAELLADEIQAFQPHLVGLQEVSLIQVQSPGDYLLGNPQAATEVAYDYLEILLAALAARGLSYSPVAEVENLDIELPGADGTDIRVHDREVLLARDDLDIGDVLTGNFTARLQAEPIEVPRGWVSAVATLAGQSFRVLSTHLETAASPAVQVAQGDELLRLLEGETLPVVLLGDYNSAARDSRTATYASIISSGYVDAWEQVHPGQDGFTCCHADDLRNADVLFNRRLDHVFFRGDFTALQAEIVGDDQTRRTPEGLWPSDHGGQVVTLSLEEPTPVLESAGAQPVAFRLEANYPNPFNSATVIRFSLPDGAWTALEIYDLAGQKVATLAQGILPAGSHEVRWDGRDNQGRELASGTYLYRLLAGDAVTARKLMLIR